MPKVVKITDENGTVVAAREYDAFGKVLSETGDWSRSRFAFHPNWIELKDSGGRLYLTPGGRVYDTETGRFLQRDPVAKPGANWYAAFRSSPVQFVDASGAAEANCATAKTYIVQPGDGLWRIAEELDVSREELKNANPQITDWQGIRPGDKVNIPAKKEDPKPEPPPTPTPTPTPTPKPKPKPKPATYRITIKVTRKTQTCKSTTGEFIVTVDGLATTVSGATLEPKSREDAKGKKPYRIPAGRYQSLVRTSNKGQPQEGMNGRVVALEKPGQISTVPGFAGVLIHIGNGPQDTQGCILVGTDRSTDWVTESSKKMASLVKLYDEAKKANNDKTPAIEVVVEDAFSGGE